MLEEETVGCEADWQGRRDSGRDGSHVVRQRDACLMFVLKYSMGGLIDETMMYQGQVHRGLRAKRRRT